MNGNSITNLLMPFDTNDPGIAKDYSGNTKNGNVTGPTWEADGVVGGAYQFNGIDDIISLPYCFDEDNYIDEFTVETWINTSEDSVGIASFDKNIFWDLSIANGAVKWTTNANDNSADIFGNKVAEKKYQQGFISDGFPRTLNQAKIFDGSFLSTSKVFF